jgi:serine/threonine protein kinase
VRRLRIALAVRRWICPPASLAVQGRFGHAQAHTCKVLRRCARPHPGARGRQVREYGIHRALRHASVVALTDLFEIDAAAFATVLELCPGGDLDAHLQRHPVRRAARPRSGAFLWVWLELTRTGSATRGRFAVFQLLLAPSF